MVNQKLQSATVIGSLLVDAEGIWFRREVNDPSSPPEN